MEGLYKYIRFEKDGENGAGDPETKPEGNDKKPDTWTKEQQDEFDKRAASLRKAAYEKAKADAQKELEEAQAKAKADAEKKALEEQGKFKEAAQLAEKAKADAEAKAAKAEAEAKTLKLQNEFWDVADELELEFVSKQAAKDAYALLDAELVGEDGSGMKKALEKLQKDRPYLFGADRADDEDTNTDAREKGKRQKRQEVDDEKRKELVSRFRIRKPR